MDKSVEKVLKKDLQKFHDKLAIEKNNISELYEVFDEARFIAGCRSCDNEMAYSKLKFAERYVSCRSDETCNVVTKIAEKIKKAEKQEESLREEYGKKLFKFLLKYQPALATLEMMSDAMNKAAPAFDDSVKIWKKSAIKKLLYSLD